MTIAHCPWYRYAIMYCYNELWRNVIEVPQYGKREFSRFIIHVIVSVFTPWCCEPITGYDDRVLQHRYDDRGSGRYEDDRLSYVKESSSAQSAARYSDDERYKKRSRRDAEERREEGSQERISREREGRSDKDEHTSSPRQKKKSSKRKLFFGSYDTSFHLDFLCIWGQYVCKLVCFHHKRSLLWQCILFDLPAVEYSVVLLHIAISPLYLIIGYFQAHHQNLRLSLVTNLSRKKLRALVHQLVEVMLVLRNLLGLNLNPHHRVAGAVRIERRGNPQVKRQTKTSIWAARVRRNLRCRVRGREEKRVVIERKPSHLRGSAQLHLSRYDVHSFTQCALYVMSLSKIIFTSY